MQRYSCRGSEAFRRQYCGEGLENPQSQDAKVPNKRILHRAFYRLDLPRRVCR